MSTNGAPSISLLIIDDNAGSMEMLSAALAQPGLEIMTASEPETGLDLVHDRRPQIVLTDLVMPHMSGIEVLERTMEFDPSIEVILMTAHYSTESAVEAIKKGAADYLNKPVSIATLWERVGKLDAGRVEHIGEKYAEFGFALGDGRRDRRRQGLGSCLGLHLVGDAEPL